jgi:hypothetical protein
MYGDLNNYYNIEILLKRVCGCIIVLPYFNRDNLEELKDIGTEYNLKFILEIDHRFPLIDHKCFKYIVKNGKDLKLLDTLPRSSLIIRRISVNDLIEYNITLNADEMPYASIHINASTIITEEFINNIPDISCIISIPISCIKNLLLEYNFHLINSLFKKCNIVKHHIRPFIEFVEELTTYVNIIWYTELLHEAIKYDKLYYIYHGQNDNKYELSSEILENNIKYILLGLTYAKYIDIFIEKYPDIKFERYI